MILQRHLADTLAGRREVRVEHRWCRRCRLADTAPESVAQNHDRFPPSASRRSASNCRCRSWPARCGRPLRYIRRKIVRKGHRRTNPKPAVRPAPASVRQAGVARLHARDSNRCAGPRACRARGFVNSPAGHCEEAGLAAVTPSGASQNFAQLISSSGSRHKRGRNGRPCFARVRFAREAAVPDCRHLTWCYPITAL